MLKGVFYTHPRHAAKHGTKASKETSANNKIANYNHTARGTELFSYTILNFFFQRLLPAGSSICTGIWKKVPVFAAEVGRGNAAYKHQDLRKAGEWKLGRFKQVKVKSL